MSARSAVLWLYSVFGKAGASYYGTADLALMLVGYQVDLWEKISNSRKAFLLDQQSSRQDVESTALALTASASELWYGIAAEQATGFGAACRQLPGRNALSGGARS